MKLGRLGVWYGTDKLDGSQLRDFVRTVENNGYSNLWYPESRGYESMSLAAWLLSSSEKLVVGSSIANIYARDSFTAQRALISLNALYGGRFVLVFFMVLLLSAVGPDLVQLVAGASLLAGLYIYLVAGNASTLDPWPLLTRVPFLYVVALYYGHIATWVREQAGEIAHAL